jgi:kynurenine formamidase
MRDVPDPPLRPWSPPEYEVDADGKVVGARPGEPNHWGRWGDNDQLGTANLFSAERVAAAARLVRRGKRFALGLPIGGIATPGHYRGAPLHLYNFAAGDGVLAGGLGGEAYQVSDDYLVMALQASTQLDGFGHVGAEHTLYNGYWAGLVTSSLGAQRLGIHHLANGLAGRGVLLDVARHAGVGHLEPGYAIGPSELAGTAAAQRVEIAPGDVLLVRTGHLGWWLGLDREGKAAVGADEPGMSTRAIPWLADHDVAMLALDTTALEVRPPEPDAPFLTFHVAALRDLGLLLGELFELDELATDCANDGVYEGFFVAAPMPVVGGSGSPLNPLVFK